MKQPIQLKPIRTMKKIAAYLALCAPLFFSGCYTGSYMVNTRMGMTVKEFCDENVGEQLLEQEGNDYLFTLDPVSRGHTITSMMEF